jgi:hypothetical protein
VLIIRYEVKNLLTRALLHVIYQHLKKKVFKSLNSIELKRDYVLCRIAHNHVFALCGTGHHQNGISDKFIPKLYGLKKQSIKKIIHKGKCQHMN